MTSKKTQITYILLIVSISLSVSLLAFNSVEYSYFNTVSECYELVIIDNEISFKEFDDACFKAHEELAVYSDIIYFSIIGLGFMPMIYLIARELLD